jgi:hypothetical protein
LTYLDAHGPDAVVTVRIVTFRPRSCLATLSAVFWVVSCGGSSSETPPPLEPLPVNLHYDRSSTALSGELPVVASDAGSVARAKDEPPPSEEPPARSTWGSDKPVPQTPLK